MGRGPVRNKSSIVRFFFEAVTEGIRKRTKSFLSMAGFLCALGFVYAANDSAHQWINSKLHPTKVQEVENPESEASEASRDPASMGGSVQMPMASIEPTSRGSASSGSENQAPQIDSRSNAGSLGSQGGGYGGGGSVGSAPMPGRAFPVGNSIANNEPKPETPPKTQDPDTASSGLGPQNGVFTSPTPASVTDSGSGTVNVGGGGPTLASASGFQISSGGGTGQGSFLTAQVSIGEVTGPNYNENTQFVLVSGMAALSSGF
jgi:hypothetical protein